MTSPRPSRANMTSSLVSSPVLEEIITDPAGSSGITGGDDAIRYNDLASYVRDGNWDMAERFLESNPDGVRRIITPDGCTALHLAISCGNNFIANELMKLMQQEDFLLRDVAGQTALHHAVQSVDVGHVLFETLMRMMSQEALGIQDASGRTALHHAALSGQVEMVKTLVQAMKEQDLEKKENGDQTALSFAVVIGNIDMVEKMVEKNRNLLRIKFQERIPVVSASTTQHREMMEYLFKETPDEELQGIQGFKLLNTFILRKMFDIALHHALDLVERCRLPAATDPYNCVTLQLLLVLAGMPSAFRSGSRLLFWQRWIYSLFVRLQDNSNSQIGHALRVVLKRIFKHIYLQKKMNEDALKLQGAICREIQKQNSGDNEARKRLFHMALIEATKNGIYEIVHEIINTNPRLFFETVIDSRRMIDLAILHRQEKIFNLIYGLHETSWAFFISHRDRNQNTMLHLAGMSPFNHLTRISGAALRMQRELQWFKEVERILDPLDRNAKNKYNKTAHELFTENHVKLVEDGEKWMKAMASSCTVVAALIVTIMFAAAFTVPGGNNQESGAPIFLQKKLFLTFIICDAISFFTSSASVLMFVVILTARYSEEYFLEYLPRMMIIGLSSFFISFITMTVAFCAALFLMLRGQPIWVFIVIFLYACVPVILFPLFQFPLLLEMLTSTCGSSIFNKKKNLLTLSPFKMGVVTLQKPSTIKHANEGAKMD